MNQYVFNIPNDNTTIRLYGEGNTAWGDGTTDSLNEHVYSSAGSYTVNTDLYISNRKAVSRYERDKDTISYLIAASIDLNYIKELEEIEKMYFFFNLFNGCSNLQTVEFTNSITIDTQVKTCHMFDNCSKLNNITGLTNIHLNNLIDMDNMFNNCIILKDSSIDVTSFKSTKWMDFKNAFRNCKGLVRITLPKSTSSEKIPVSCLSMFEGCTNLRNVTNLSDYSITNARSMFLNCTSMVSAPLMFIYDCKDTSFMFSGCSSLVNIHTNSINFTNVLDMYADNIDYSNIKVFTPERCRYMFDRCTSLKQIDLSFMNLMHIKNLNERPDLVMDEKILLRLPDDAEIKDYTSWILPIDYYERYYEKYDDTVNYIHTLDIARNTFSLVYSGNNQLFLCSTNLRYPLIFNLEPSKFMTSNEYFVPYFDEAFPVEKNVIMNGKKYALARRLFGLTTKGSQLLIDKGNFSLNMFVYEKGVKYDFSNLNINYQGLIKYKINSEVALSSKSIISYTEYDEDGDISSVSLPIFYDQNNNVIPNTSSVFNYTLVKNNTVLDKDITETFINEVDEIYIQYPYYKVSNIKFNGIDTTDDNNRIIGHSVSEILECTRIYGNSEITFSKNFKNCTKLKNIPTELVDPILKPENIDTKYMFKNCYALTEIDISTILSDCKLSNPSYMFSNCNALEEINTNNFNISGIDATEMFNGCNVLNSDITINGYDNIINASNLFDNCNNISNISLNNVKLNNMTHSFNNCNNLSVLDINNCDLSHVTDISFAWNNCYVLVDLDLSAFSGVKINDCYNAFMNCRSLEHIDLSNFDTSRVAYMSFMFNGCDKLISLDLSSFDTSNVTDMRYMFENCSSLTSLDLSNFNTSKVTNMQSMFSGCSSLTSLDASNWNTSNVTSMFAIFKNCYALTLLDVSNFDTSSVTSMSGMFQNCKSLTSLDVSNFDTSNVTDMTYMFNSCSKLTSLDVSNFDTSRVVYMDNMFNSCSKLTSLDVSNFDTSNVTSMSFIFSGCDKLTSLDLSNFNTSKAVYMDYMFYYCSSLTSLDVSNFDTSRVTNMSFMFENCLSLISLDLSNFDTSRVTNMQNMFYYCKSLASLDVSNFNTINVTYNGSMFYNVPTTVNWNYTGSNYTNFTLTESDTNYSGTFPWNE